MQVVLLLCGAQSGSHIVLKRGGLAEVFVCASIGVCVIWRLCGHIVVLLCEVRMCVFDLCCAGISYLCFGIGRVSCAQCICGCCICHIRLMRSSYSGEYIVSARVGISSMCICLHLMGFMVSCT